MKELEIYRMAHRADSLIRQNLRPFSKTNIKRSLLARRPGVDPIFWNTGVLTWALHRYAEHFPQQAANFTSYNRLRARRYSPTLVDHTLFFYGVYSQLNDEDKETVSTFLTKSARDNAGSILYRESQSAAFLDTVGMVAPFLIRYGAERERSDTIEIGLQQLYAFFDHGLDADSQLPYHGYDLVHGEKCGIIGWGRGVGWLMVGLAESLAWLEQEAFAEVSDLFRHLADTVLRYQRLDGGLSWQLSAKEGPIDTSAISMVGYALSRYARITGESKFLSHELLLSDALREHVASDGGVRNSSAECMGFSMYPQLFEVNSWGQGFALLFTLERLENPSIE